MRYKILIVDDSKLARMAMNAALDALHPDWIRVEAANVSDAMGALAQNAPDIAVLDFNMPGGDGLALAADIRKANPRMPVAVISANHQKEVLARAEAVGATFLPKPLTHKALREFLQSAVHRLEEKAS